MLFLMFSNISENSQEKTCARVSLLTKLQASNFNFIKKESLVQLFSTESREILTKTYFVEKGLGLQLYLKRMPYCEFYKNCREKPINGENWAKTG